MGIAWTFRSHRRIGCSVAWYTPRQERTQHSVYCRENDALRGPDGNANQPHMKDCPLAGHSSRTRDGDQGPDQVGTGEYSLPAKS
eukprot:scaffold336_cov384-Prasinococcus_capsulatus_cf.AAC.17